MNNIKDKYFWILYAALLVLIVIRIIPYIYPASRTWGFNHLLFLPDGYSTAFFVIAAFALILPFNNKSSEWGSNLIEWFNTVFFESPKRFLYRTLFIIPFAVVFVLFTMPNHFLGDGYAILQNIAADSNTLFKWSEIGIIVLLKSVREILGPADMPTAKLTVHLISIIAGIVSIWFYFGIAEYCSDNKLRRLLAFAALLFSGSMLLFFGYAEHYPILSVFVSGLIFFGLRYIKRGKGLLWHYLFLVGGLILHLQMAVFIPASIYIGLFSGEGNLKVRWKNSLTWVVAIIAVLSIAGIFIYKIKTDLYFQAMFLGFFEDNVEGSAYTIFSMEHLLDIVNQSLLLSPILVLLLTAIDLRSLFNLKNRKAVFLALLSIGSLAFILFIDPTLGMARDWDLFAFSFTAIAILAVLLMNKEKFISIRRMTISIVGIAALMISPFILTNLSKDGSAEYAEYIVSQDINRSLGTLFSLYEYYSDQDDMPRAESIKNIYDTRFERRNKCDSAINALKRYDIRTAASIVNRIKPNKYDAYYHKMMSRYYFLLKDYGKAMEYINRLIQLRRYNADNYGDRASIYMAQGRIDKALVDLRHGYDLNDSSIYVIDGLTNTYARLNMYDSTIFYGTKRLAIDSSNVIIYFLIARSYLMMKDYANGELYTRQFARFNSNDPAFQNRLGELQKLLHNSDVYRRKDTE